MAKYSDQQIRDYVQNLEKSGLSGAKLDKAVAKAANKFDVSAAQIGRTFGISTAEVDNRARKVGTTVRRNLTTGADLSSNDINQYVSDLRGLDMSDDEFDAALKSAANKYGVDLNQVSNAQSLVNPLNPAAALQEAYAGTRKAMNYSPEQVAATSYDPAQVATTDLSAYMNPYTQEVIDRSMADLERARLSTTNNLGFSASQAGAFGGSRHGVAEALTNEGFANQAGNLAAGLRQQGFNTALGQAQYDVGAQNAALQFGAQQGMNAQQLNQNAGLQGAQLNMNASNQMGQLGNLGFTQQRTLSNDMFNQGLAQQQLNQQALNAAMGQYGTWAGYPAYGLGLSGSAMPDAVGGTTTGTSNPGALPALGWGLNLYQPIP